MFFSNGTASSSLLLSAYKGGLEIVELLIANGASIQAVDGAGETPLHKACAQGHRDIAEFLIAHGAQVNVKSKQGDTPLYKAVVGCHQDIVKLLLDCGATIDLDIAVILGDVTLIEEHLTQGIDLKSQKITQGSRKGYTWLGISVQYQHKDLFEFLLNHGALVNQKGGTFQRAPLHEAAISNTLDMAEILIARGADVNALDKFGNTSVHWASRMGHEKMVKLLVELGANINILDPGNRTVLFGAAEHHHVEIVKYLLSKGAEVNIRNNQMFEKYTPLMCAFERENNDEIIKELVAHGADVNIQGDNGVTPLHLAVEKKNKNLVEFLLAQGAREGL